MPLAQPCFETEILPCLTVHPPPDTTAFSTAKSTPRQKVINGIENQAKVQKLRPGAHWMRLRPEVLQHRATPRPTAPRDTPLCGNNNCRSTKTLLPSRRLACCAPVCVGGGVRHSQTKSVLSMFGSSFAESAANALMVLTAAPASQSERDTAARNRVGSVKFHGENIVAAVNRSAQSQRCTVPHTLIVRVQAEFTSTSITRPRPCLV